jgi:energy-coupling factor transporter ATP-binding protein EcfA2
MSTINFGSTVTLAQAAQLIKANPKVRFLVRGEPGIGKSTMLSAIAKALPTHSPAYIDVPNMDLGDIAMPVVDHETRTTRYYPNARFRLHEGKPVIIMLDEFSKGLDPIKNMLHPLLEVTAPRLGDLFIDEGVEEEKDQSIIFMTGNLATDGVGDMLKAHTRNRIVEITVKKPDSDQWLEWAVNNDIDPSVMAWVQQFPQAMASYTDGDTDNPYIYNPRSVQTAYVSPRSLAIASSIVKTRNIVGADSTIAALKGCIGEAAARDMQAFVDYQDQLPTWDAIQKDPDTTAVPTSAGACAVLVFGAISKVDRQSINPFMKYLERFEPEWQACFAIQISKNPTKQAVAFASPSFAKWVAQNEDIL